VPLLISPLPQRPSKPFTKFRPFSAHRPLRIFAWPLPFPPPPSPPQVLLFCLFSLSFSLYFHLGRRKKHRASPPLSPLSLRSVVDLCPRWWRMNFFLNPLCVASKFVPVSINFPPSPSQLPKVPTFYRPLPVVSSRRFMDIRGLSLPLSYFNFQQFLAPATLSTLFRSFPLSLFCRLKNFFLTQKT